MSGDREATSKQSSSVREGAGYDEVYPSGHVPVKDLTWSLEREPYAHSPNEEEEEYEDDEEGEREVDEGEKEEEGDEEEGEEEDRAEGDEAVAQTDGRGHRKFIFPLIWTMNDFYPTMSQKIFDTLPDRYQIPKNIPFGYQGS